MKTVKNHPLLAVTLSIAATTVWFWRAGDFQADVRDETSTSSTEIQATSHSIAQNSAAPQEAPLLGAYITPITFYGKVVDQFGHPVVDAVVEAIAQNTPLGNGSAHRTSSDSNGDFSIMGAVGAYMIVKVKKLGYHRIIGKQADRFSQHRFVYASALGSEVHRADKSKPVIFTLRRHGVLEPLIIRPEMDFDISSDGTAARVYLDNAKKKYPFEIAIAVKSVSGTSTKYDWQVSLRAVEGMLSECVETFAFEAPLDGYRQEEVVKMSHLVSDSEWGYRFEKSFFLRFSDGVYGKVWVRCYARQNAVVVFKSWLNPKVGSRNLEHLE